MFALCVWVLFSSLVPVDLFDQACRWQGLVHCSWALHQNPDNFFLTNHLWALFVVVISQLQMSILVNVSFRGWDSSWVMRQLVEGSSCWIQPLQTCFSLEEGMFTLVQPADSACGWSTTFLSPAGWVRSAGRRNRGTQQDAVVERSQRCSMSWPSSCPSPTAPAPAWTRPPSWGWPSVTYAWGNYFAPVSICSRLQTVLPATTSSLYYYIY